MTFVKAIVLIGIAAVMVLQLFSCKKDKCPPLEILYLDKDTALVTYTALESFKFIIKDTLGNFLDSATFIGKGKTKYIGDSRTEGNGYGCTKITDLQAMDFTYQNAKDSNHTLVISITQGGFDSEFEIALDKLYNSHILYQGSTSYFYNPGFTAFHDSLIVEGKTYYHVVKFTRDSKNAIGAYYGKYDGLLFLEETHNRIWYKLP